MDDALLQVRLYRPLYSPLYRPLSNLYLTVTTGAKVRHSGPLVAPRPYIGPYIAPYIGPYIAPYIGPWSPPAPRLL